LHRIVIAESQRFPALARVMNESGTKAGVDRMAALLEHGVRTGYLRPIDYRFVAEQFLTMVVTAPRRRALGFDDALTPAELDAWAEHSVNLFLHGCRAAAPSPDRDS